MSSEEMEKKSVPDAPKDEQPRGVTIFNIIRNNVQHDPPMTAPMRSFFFCWFIRLSFAYVLLACYVGVCARIMMLAERDAEIDRNVKKAKLGRHMLYCLRTIQTIAYNFGSTPTVVDDLDGYNDTHTPSDFWSSLNITRLKILCTEDNIIGNLEYSFEPTDYWELLTSSFFVYTAISTIGYGTFVPQTFNGRLSFMCISSLGIPLAAWIFGLVSSPLTTGVDLFLRRIVLVWFDVRKKRHPPKAMIYIFLLLAVLVAMHLFGGYAYDYLNDWGGVFESVYFTFVTLTTIGFGDLVPVGRLSLGFSFFFVTLGLGVMASMIGIMPMLLDRNSWRLVHHEVDAPDADFGPEEGSNHNDYDQPASEECGPTLPLPNRGPAPGILGASSMYALRAVRRVHPATSILCPNLQCGNVVSELDHVCPFCDTDLGH